MLLVYLKYLQKWCVHYASLEHALSKPSLSFEISSCDLCKHYSITVTNVPLCSVIWTHNSSRVPHRSVQMLVAFHIPVFFASSKAVLIEHPQRWVFWVVRCVFSGLPRGTKFLYLWCRSWNLALTASWEFSEFDVAAVSSCSMHCHLTRWTPHLQLSELAVF